jgi:hypothetical protein
MVDFPALAWALAAAAAAQGSTHLKLLVLRL